MNPMKTIPVTVTDFAHERRLEQLGRCAFFHARNERIRAELAAVAADTALAADEAQFRYDYLRALRHRMNTLHHDAHKCYPFSRN